VRNRGPVRIRRERGRARRPEEAGRRQRHAGRSARGGAGAAVVDALHAITAERPYRARRPYDAALAEIRLRAGTQFDPAVVDALERIDPTRIEPLLEPTQQLEPAVEPQLPEAPALVPLVPA
jgi:hypothetical protein